MDFLRKLFKGSGAESKSDNVPLGIIIAGPPASGKGTQCENITKQFGVVHISTGDMLRAAMKKRNADSAAGEAMNKGGLVSDEVVIEIVRARLAEADVKKNGFLLDGFPRTEAQAIALQNLGVKVDCVILLEVPDEKLVSRVLGRRTDPVSKKIYNINDTDNLPPKEILDRLEKRGDDTEDKLKTRLGEFHKNIEPVVKVYGDEVRRIDGDKLPGEVWEQVEKELEAVSKQKSKDALLA